MASEVKFVLRMPPQLHAKLKRRAKRSNTSMNKDMINILNSAVGEKSTDKLLIELIGRLEKKRVI